MNKVFTQGHAIVIGVGSDLPNTVGDAVGLANILQEPGRCAYPATQVHLLTGEKATRTAILATFDTLAQATDAQSTVIVYFSGHGYRVISPTGKFYYLLPFGYDLSKLYQTAISGAEFTARLQAISAQKLLVLLDCCHAGGVGEAKVPGLQLAQSPLPPEAQELLAEGSGRVLISSSQEDEISFAGKPYSAFTLALVEALSGVGVAKKDGYVRVADLAMHARQVVPGRTKDRQHPILHFEHADNFVLAYYAGGDTQPKGVPFTGKPSIEPEPGSGVAFDLRSQTVHGPQTLIEGDVALPGTFHGPVSIGGEVADMRWAETMVYKPTIVESPPLPEIQPPPEVKGLQEVTDFVGREKELAYFSDKLAVSNLAVISGMAGVGKTTLATVLSNQAGDSHKTFWHSFYEGEGSSNVIRKLAGFLYQLGREDLWRTLENARLAGGQPRQVHLLLDYLNRAIRGQGYLLCFDNLQSLSDDDAPLFNEFIRQLLTEDTSFIITSRRMPEVGRRFKFKELVGLSYADTLSLLDRRGLPLPDDLSADLHEHTGGNAQLLILAIDALLHDTEKQADLVAGLSKVDDIESYLLYEVHRNLTKDEQGVMGAIAVLLDYPGSRDAIEAVADKDGLQQTLIDLKNRYLLIADSDNAGQECYKQHDIVRAFYYNLLGRRERRPMHRRAGEYYEIEEPDALKAARHFQEAGEYGRSVRLATGDVWALINQGQAQMLRQLLKKFTAQQLETEQWVAVNLARGQVYALLGQGQQAQESYQQALSQLDTFPDSPTVGELKASACRGMGHLLEFESPDEALEWLRRGLDELKSANTLEEALLFLRIGSVLVAKGEYGEAQVALEKSLGLLPEDASQWRAGVLGNLGIIHFYQGDTKQAEDNYQPALEIYQQLNDLWGLAGIWHNLGVVMETAGDWDGAVDRYEKALKQAEQLGSITRQTDIELALGVLLTNKGDIEAAREHLAKSLELAQQHDLKAEQIHIKSWLAELNLRLEEWDAAEDLLEEAERLADEINAKNQLPEIYRGWAQVHLARNDIQAALDFAERSIDLASEMDLKPEEGMSLRVLGQVLFTSGKQEPAEEAFEKSLSLLENYDTYEAARTKFPLGVLLVSSGKVERGKTMLEEAKSEFQRLGAERDQAAVQSYLETLGKSPQP
jgi:tetratricopeptide (TPR) repeat protein